MKRMRILGLALVAVFALGAITVASASATPAFYECKKESSKTEGKFSKGCTAAGTGYELAPGVGSKGKGFKSSGANAHLEVVVPPGVSKEFEGGATIKIECTSNKGVGSDVLPNKVDKVKTTFKGCSTLGNPCQSGSKKGEIITNELAGELVDTEYGVGQVLGPETGLTSATFTCTGIATTNVHGSLIGLVKGDVNTISKESETEFIVGPGLGAVPYVAENSKKENLNVRPDSERPD